MPLKQRTKTRKKTSFPISSSYRRAAVTTTLSLSLLCELRVSPLPLCGSARVTNTTPNPQRERKKKNLDIFSDSTGMWPRPLVCVLTCTLWAREETLPHVIFICALWDPKVTTTTVSRSCIFTTTSFFLTFPLKLYHLNFFSHCFPIIIYMFRPFIGNTWSSNDTRSVVVRWGRRRKEASGWAKETSVWRW